MTPCVITDGPVAYGFDKIYETKSYGPIAKPICVGCGWGPKSTGVPRPLDWDQQVKDAVKQEAKRGAGKPRG